MCQKWKIFYPQVILSFSSSTGLSEHKMVAAVNQWDLIGNDNYQDVILEF